MEQGPGQKVGFIVVLEQGPGQKVGFIVVLEQGPGQKVGFPYDLSGSAHSVGSRVSSTIPRGQVQAEWRTTIPRKRKAETSGYPTIRGLRKIDAILKIDVISCVLPQVLLSV